MSVNRTICDVLEALRKCYENRNFSYMLGLIDEAQNMANRMESGLWDQKDVEYNRKEVKRLKSDIETLEAKKENLDVKAGKGK